MLNNDIAHSRASIEQLQQEIDAAGESDADAARQAETYREQAAAAEQRIAAEEKQIAELTERLEQLTASAQATGERRGVLTAQLNELTGRMTDLKVAAAGAASAQQSARSRLEALEGEESEGAAQREQLESERRENAEYLERCTAELTRLNNIKEGLSLKLASRQKALGLGDRGGPPRPRASARPPPSGCGSCGISRTAWTATTRVSNRSSRRPRITGCGGFIGPVSSVVTVRAGYELAIETALGFAAQNIVVQDESAARAAIALLKQERAGRATFLPLDTVRPSHFDRARMPEGASLASDLVEADPKYANIVSNLLGRVLVVEELGAAGRAAKSLDYRYRVVTMDGQVVNAGGSFTGGSASRSAGLFTRRTEIEELGRKIKMLTQQRAEKLAALDKAKAEREKLAAELAATESEAITASGDKIRAEAEQNRLDATLAQRQAADELRTAEREELTRRAAQAEQIIQDSESERARLGRQADGLEQDLAALADGDDSFLSARSRLSDEISQCKLDRLSAEKDLDAAKSAIETLKSRSGESAQRVEGLRDSIRRLEASIQENERKIAEAGEKKRLAAQRIEEEEQAIKEATEQRLEKEGSITRQNARVRELTDQREALTKEIARLDERRVALESEYDATTAKLWEEYEMTLSDAMAMSVPFESVTELRRGVTEVRGKIRALGNVNVGAIEEYAEVRERYDFMRGQVEDVEKSKAELTGLIGKLSGEMREIFQKNFEQINANFSRIFAELFGGGSARLSLSDPDNVLESGIEISVSPPGKIIKNLSALSGGEQALVAISIYFAILAVNPAPFCILDEIEAALDDVNVVRYASYLRRICDRTQFIVITHRRGTMEEADVLYGVTMQEDGVSRLLKLDVSEVDVKLIS